MPFDRMQADLHQELEQLDAAGTSKGPESVVVRIKPAEGGRGPRFLIEGEGDKEFIRMNSNSYLGLSFRKELLEAEEHTARLFGVGPGAVRFISGTYEPHLKLERALAQFHGREAAHITSAAYNAVMGVLVTLTTPETVLISDELNHNCIVNGAKLARPKERKVYKHNDVGQLDRVLREAAEAGAKSAIVVTDGVFSMRGDIAPLAQIAETVRKHDARFPRNAVLFVDDSHGVGAFGPTGRGSEEISGARADILVGTLGKAFGVNGGYVTGSALLVRWLREKNPFYIYSNPISAGEAAAALRALEIVQNDEGQKLLGHLATMTRRFRDGLVRLGFETIEGQHPVVPLLVRDTDKTRALVKFLRQNGVLATGLNYPVVPKGEQLIRFQVNASHTAQDVDQVLEVLRRFKDQA